MVCSDACTAAMALGRAVADEGARDEQFSVADEGFGVEAAGGLAGDDALVAAADNVVASFVEAEKPDGGVLVLVVGSTTSASPSVRC